MSINPGAKISTTPYRNVPERPSAKVRITAVTASGLLLGASFPPFPFAPLAWVSLVPLLWLWERHPSWRAAYLDASGAFILTFALAFHWPLFHVLPKTALLSAPFLLLLPAWMAIPFAAAHAIRRRLGPATGFCALVTLFITMELALRRGPMAFPWALLGHTQADLHPLNQIAFLGGVPLLTLLVLLLNVSTLLALRGRYRLVAGTAAAVLLGMLASVNFSGGGSGNILNVGFVQPALSAADWASTTDSARVELLVGLTGEIVDADLVVWPETALHLRQHHERPPWIQRIPPPLLTGAILREGDFYRNAAILFETGRVGEIYRKTRLVPFAEHVPYRELLPWLDRLAIPAGGVRGYLPGSELKIFEIPQAHFGVLICFESLFDDLARAYARAGAGVLIVITQDGWWGDSFGFRQHLAFNRLRAIETGLPVIQASVSGYSAVIDSEGRITGRHGWMERGAWIEPVVTGRASTLFSRTGDVISRIALFAGILLIGAAIGLGRRHPREDKPSV